MWKFNFMQKSCGVVKIRPTYISIILAHFILNICAQNLYLKLRTCIKLFWTFPWPMNRLESPKNSSESTMSTPENPTLKNPASSGAMTAWISIWTWKRRHDSACWIFPRTIPTYLPLRQSSFSRTRSNLHFNPEFTARGFKKFQQKIKLPPVGVGSITLTITEV